MTITFKHPVYGELPAFSNINNDRFIPIIEQGMEENRKEINNIASNLSPATFENTIEVLESAGKTLSDIMHIYGVYSSCLSTPEFQKIEEYLEPKLSAFSDELFQNQFLFDRIKSLYLNLDQLNDNEQKRVVKEYYNDFVRSGAALNEESKQRLTIINQRLSTLYTKFSQNVLADEESSIELTENDLTGLSESFCTSIKDGNKYVIANTRSSVEPFLTYSSREDLRKQVFDKYVSRGDNTNKVLIPEILKLRNERANLMGYKTTAHFEIADNMAKTPENAMQLMQNVYKNALNRVKEEVKDMLEIAKNDNKYKIEPWDYRYYAEKVRKVKFDIDQNEIKPYLQLEKLREGMFWVAEQLFNFVFEQVFDVQLYHEDVRVWKITNKASNKFVGLLYFDPYARKGKHSGAWMCSYRKQESFKHSITPVVSNNANFIKSKDVLISWDDANTLFHEFGHALHGLCSNVKYPTLSGTSVPSDYVEFPSQLFENWLSTPELLSRFAIHYQSNLPMPTELLEKIKNSSKFNLGFSTVEYLASAFIDLKLHLTDKEVDVDEFEKTELANLDMPSEIVMRHRMPHFNHIFSGDHYSSGYYSYIWADVISADAFEAFTETDNVFNREISDRLLKNVLSVGNSIDPEEGYIRFRGRAPTVDALMKKRGFLE
jgi:peptidyl-dipeptidase Dcp